jgi:hypothetical protein
MKEKGMIFKTIIICLLVIAISLLVVDISERNANRSVIQTETPTKSLPPLVLPPVVLPPSDYPYPMRDINYTSHISGRVSVMENPNARDVSYGELLKFLLEDQTDKIIYEENVFSCPDFAEILQHNAEIKGINCAWVYADLLEIVDHSLNAFMTTDQGLIFIDDSGVIAGVTHPYNMDKTVIVNRGQRYCPESLFPESGWGNKWNCTGTVVDYKIYWTGDM